MVLHEMTRDILFQQKIVGIRKVTCIENIVGVGGKTLVVVFGQEGTGKRLSVYRGWQESPKDIARRMHWKGLHIRLLGKTLRLF